MWNAVLLISNVAEHVSRVQQQTPIGSTRATNIHEVLLSMRRRKVAPPPPRGHALTKVFVPLYRQVVIRGAPMLAEANWGDAEYGASHTEAVIIRPHRQHASSSSQARAIQLCIRRAHILFTVNKMRNRATEAREELFVDYHDASSVECVSDLDFPSCDHLRFHGHGRDSVLLGITHAIECFCRRGQRGDMRYCTCACTDNDASIASALYVESVIPHAFRTECMGVQLRTFIQYPSWISHRVRTKVRFIGKLIVAFARVCKHRYTPGGAGALEAQSRFELAVFLSARLQGQDVLLHLSA